METCAEQLGLKACVLNLLSSKRETRAAWKVPDGGRRCRWSQPEQSEKQLFYWFVTELGWILDVQLLSLMEEKTTRTLSSTCFPPRGIFCPVWVFQQKPGAHTLSPLSSSSSWGSHTSSCWSTRGAEGSRWRAESSLRRQPSPARREGERR